MNNENIINIMNSLFECCDSMTDAKNYSEMLIDKYPEYSNTIESYRDSYNYNESMDLSTKLYSITSLIESNNINNSDTIINNIKSKTNDKILLHVLKRLYSNCKKSNRNIESNNNDNTTIVKNCPHCNMTYTRRSSANTTYLICGYTDTKRGYDMKGCGKDWCFKCGKKLCKSWENDHLYLESNRKHDTECCFKKSIMCDEDHNTEYCHCYENIHIDLDIININF